MLKPTSLAEQLLIAMPGLEDGYFSRTVALVCQHDENGAMGLVLNVDSEYTLGTLFDQLDMPCQNPKLRQQTVLAGGPVNPERGFVLHNDGTRWDSSMQLGNGMSISTSRDILSALANGSGPDQFQVLLGYSGWAAGQLEEELADNAWLNAPASTQIVFEAPMAERWQAAAQQIGVDLSLISLQSGHA